MSITAQAILKAAAIWRGRGFSEAHYGKSPYCASFVRWCFKQVNGAEHGLPEAGSVPYYVRKGIHVSPGVWYADSLAGDEIGPVVTHQQPGDLLFFHDTARGPWPVGSITHVGIAADSGGLMTDAGGGSLVHFRSHHAIFPGLLAEIRRPRALGGPTNGTSRTAIVIARGHAFGMMHGRHVRDVTIQFVRRPGTTTSTASNPSPAHQSRFGIPSPTMNQMMTHGFGGSGMSGGVGSSAGHAPAHRAEHDTSTFRWEISVNGHVVKPSSVTVDIAYAGHRFKLFGHDHKAQHFLDGVRNEVTSIKLTASNGAAHLWLNGAEIKPEHAEVEIVA